MSLKNMETGQTATPLTMLQEMNEQDRQHIKTDLLKEALAISNEKCNKLIEMQNKLIEEMRANMAVTEYDLTTTVDKAVREIKTETAKTEKLNESIGIQVKKAVSTSVNDMKAEMLINVRDTSIQNAGRNPKDRKRNGTVTGEYPFRERGSQIPAVADTCIAGRADDRTCNFIALTSTE